MSLRSHRHKIATPEWREVAKKAATWAASPEGQAAFERASKAGEEAGKAFEEALRLGAESLIETELIINGRP